MFCVVALAKIFDYGSWVAWIAAVFCHNFERFFETMIPPEGEETNLRRKITLRVAFYTTNADANGWIRTSSSCENAFFFVCSARRSVFCSRHEFGCLCMFRVLLLAFNFY